MAFREFPGPRGPLSVHAPRYALQEDLDVLREEVNDLSRDQDEEIDARLAVIERALASVITDVEGLVAYLTEEGPEPDGGPDDLRMGYGSDDLPGEPMADYPEEAEETVEEEAERLRREAQQANESDPQSEPGDFNAVTDVPPEGITLAPAPGADEPQMGMRVRWEDDE